MWKLLVNVNMWSRVFQLFSSVVSCDFFEDFDHAKEEGCGIILKGNSICFGNK